MDIYEEQHPEHRSERMAEQARQEKAAIHTLDRATTCLAAAQARHHDLLTQAKAAVEAAERARREALAAYARCASPERAAFHLGLEPRHLRRLMQECRDDRLPQR